MTPARSEPKTNGTRRQTAESTGCLSGFLLPPLAALAMSILLAVFVAGFTSAPAGPAALQSASQANSQPAQPAVAPQAEPALFQGQAPVQSEPAAQAPSLPVASSGAIAPLFTPEIQFWGDSLRSWAVQNSVDANLAATVMQIESCGNPDARSSAGAIGLFQVMPFHFYSYDNAYDPATNAQRGLDYLRRSVQAAGGNARLALAGYNGGIGVINRDESTWSSETRRYVHWGYPIYEDALQNASQSLSLDEWRTATGDSLCRKARQHLGLAP
jgi:soluble lytic murein transglycosylase-like protein